MKRVCFGKLQTSLCITFYIEVHPPGRGVTVWNQLSLEIKTAPSLVAFKTKLKSFLKDQRG